MTPRQALLHLREVNYHLSERHRKTPFADVQPLLDGAEQIIEDAINGVPPRFEDVADEAIWATLRVLSSFGPARDWTKVGDLRWEANGAFFATFTSRFNGGDAYKTLVETDHRDLNRMLRGMRFRRGRTEATP